MTIQAFGDQAVLIQFEQTISPLVHAKVMAANAAIEKAKHPAIQYLMPAYCSLTIGYDALQISYDALSNQLLELIEQPSEMTAEGTTRKLQIPVCYEEEWALDKTAVMEQTGLDWETIVELHTNSPLRVYMLGFLPGFPYLGSLPKALHCRRKPHARLRVPARSVALAGPQTGIYPSEAPGGWQVIGRTPIQLFDPQQDPAFLFQSGDAIGFEAIGRQRYEELEEQIRNSTFKWADLYE